MLNKNSTEDSSVEFKFQLKKIKKKNINKGKFKL